MVDSHEKKSAAKRSFTDHLDSLLEDFYIRLENPLTEKLVSYVSCAVLNVSLIFYVFLKSPTSHSKLYLSDFIFGSFGYILFLASLANAYLFFTKTKKYNLFKMDVSELARSPNLRVTMINFPESDATESAVEVVELSMWNPSLVNKHIFIFFSPFQVVLELTAFYSSMLVPFFLAACTVATLYYLLEFYEQRIIDTQILCNQSYQELNHFAVSHMSVKKFDKAVQVGKLWSREHDGSPYSILYPSNYDLQDSPFQPTSLSAPPGSYSNWSSSSQNNLHQQ